jgi:hypothetical protein
VQHMAAGMIRTPCSTTHYHASYASYASHASPRITRQRRTTQRHAAPRSITHHHASSRITTHHHAAQHHTDHKAPFVNNLSDRAFKNNTHACSNKSKRFRPENNLCTFHFLLIMHYNAQHLKWQN